MWFNVTMATFILHTRPFLLHQPTCWQGKRTSEKCGWSENRRRLGVEQREAGAWNVFTSLNDWYVPGGACVLGSGKEDVTWGLSILSYSSHICF